MKKKLLSAFGVLVAIAAAYAVIALAPPQPANLLSLRGDGPIWNRANATTEGITETRYTIYIRPQGAVAVTYPTTFVRKAWQPPSYYISSPDPLNRTELWVDTAGSATFEEIMTACSALRPGISQQIWQQRVNALAQVTAANAGVAFVYQENYTAAAAVVNGQGDQVLMSNGMTATQYCAGLGSQIGMDAVQFANYVIQEFNAVAPAAYAIEQEYLRLTYNVIPNSRSISELLALPAAYLAFCNQ